MTGLASSPIWVDRYVSKDHCAFCQEGAELRASHILPAFVFRWLKKSGGTGHLRNARTPNRRAQDGIKIRLLCRDCEQLFSGFERQFADKLFLPYTKDDGLKLVYGDWLARFCASLSWRVLVLLIRENRLQSITAAQSKAARAALATWESFIRGDISNPGVFEQHILPFPGISETTIQNLPNNMNRYAPGGRDRFSQRRAERHGHDVRQDRAAFHLRLRGAAS
ncbi:hypothetical protein [Kaistia defluvii]|uniref:HNH endonuclease n=1 Tax=Kaistia defluvii TaxID=410841 RepID=A0ABV2QZN0_9HYPH